MVFPMDRREAKPQKFKGRFGSTTHIRVEVREIEVGSKEGV